MTHCKLRLSGSGELLRNFTFLAVSGVGIKTLGFFVALILARRLGSAGFGRVAFAQTLVVYFALMADFGLSTISIRDLSARREEIPTLWGNFFSARLMTGFLSIICLCLLAWFLPGPPQDSLLLLLFGLVLFGSTLTLDWVFRASERMDIVAAGNVIHSIVSLFLLFLFVRSEAHILLVPLFLAMGTFGRAVFYWSYFVRLYGWPGVVFDRSKIIYLLRHASILGMSLLMIQIYYNVATILIGLFRSDSEIGWYNAAYRLVFAFTNMASIVGDTIFPRLSRLSQIEDPAQHGQTMVLGAKILLYLALPIGLGGTLFSQQIISFLYGPEYGNSSPVLMIMNLQVFKVFCNVSFAYYLLAAKQQQLYLVSVTLGATINLLLNLCLIPGYGIIGASIATMVAEIVVLGMLYQYAYRFIAPAPMLVPLLKAIVGGIAFVTVAILVRNLWLGLALSLLAYGIVLLLTAPFTREEFGRLVPWRTHEQ